MHVHDELVAQRVGPLLRHRRRGGLGAADLEHGAERVVHRDEGRGHAGRGLEELAPVEALLLAELVAHVEQPRLDLLLLRALRRGQILVAGDDRVGIGVVCGSISAGIN